MIDWWVISSILAGLGTAYGANAYNKKDATELRERAAKLLSETEGGPWAERVKTLQDELNKTAEDKTKAEEAAAKLQSYIDELKAGIGSKATDLKARLEGLTRDEERKLATASDQEYAQALQWVLAELQSRYGISVTPKMDAVLKQFERNRHSLSDLWAALKEAYEKPAGGRRRRKRVGGTDPPAAVEVVPVPPAPGSPPPFPSLDEFRALWGHAFAQLQPAPPPAPSAPPLELPAPAAVTPPTKKDIAAQKAAQALSEKLTRAREAARKEIAPYTTHAETLAEDKKTAAAAALASLEGVFAELESFLPQLTQQDIREAVWTPLKTAGDALSARLAGAVKAYKDAVGSLPSSFLSWFKKTPAVPEAPAGPTTIHTELLTKTPKTLAKMASVIAALDTAFKTLDAKLKVIPTPELFRGGCAVKATAEEVQDLLEALRTRLKRRQKAYEAAFALYTKETKGAPLYDSAFGDRTLPPSETGPITTAATDLADQADTLAARVDSLRKSRRGGAKVFDKALTASRALDLEAYAFKMYATRAQSVIDDAAAVTTLIDQTIQESNRLTSPEDQAAEKASCPQPYKATPPSVAAPRVPFEFPDVDRVTVTNPLRPEGPPPPRAPASPEIEAAPSVRQPFEIEAPVSEPVPPSVGTLTARLAPDDAANISARLRSTTRGPAKASIYYELVAKWLAAWKALTQPEKLAAKEEPVQAKDLVLSAEGSTQTGGGAPPELLRELDAAIAEVESSGGRSRKSTFKRRRGGKQNGRRLSRRRKNRADRTHSHTR